MPMNRDTQEVVNVYLGAGTRERIRHALVPHEPPMRSESISEFIRAAVERELRRRDRLAQARYRRAQRIEEVAS